MIVGGGKVGNDILTRMFELAGGKDAPLVVIPTASGAEDYPADWSGLKMFKDFGATNITLLHTKDRKVADSEAFVKPITDGADRLVRRRPAVAAGRFLPAHPHAARDRERARARRRRRRLVGRRLDHRVVHGPRRASRTTSS